VCVCVCVCVSVYVYLGNVPVLGAGQVLDVSCPCDHCVLKPLNCSLSCCASCVCVCVCVCVCCIALARPYIHLSSHA
jgi:hypothetical protein